MCFHVLRHARNALCIHFSSTGLDASSRDDEYRWAGVEDPKIMVTTSLDPTGNLKQFSKVLFFTR